MQFICFGSGSSGNCYYLESRGEAILIDLGIGIRAFKKHMRDYGLTMPKIKAIIVTHDHTDHIKAVGPLSIEFRIPVYASMPVHEGIVRNRFMTKKIPEDLQRCTVLNTPFEVGNFRITPFAVPHDATDNNGYFIELIEPEETNATDLFAPQGGDGRPTFCLITDAGQFTETMIPYVQRARYLVIEANYDRELLDNGPYPLYLRKRISGGRGHMDNRLTAEALKQHLTPETRRVWLCHLSAENNNPETARRTVAEAIDALPFAERPRLDVLRRTVPSGLERLV
ncbi:MAG: MBL fold metallo-hydrolase [Prevotellaceae bacterium]|jgi:metallo-beta-lactamase family protein|nr:MBL fold metallo-hydrolase [Prevotellaceae bacterium]